MTNNEIEWRPVVGYEGFYDVSCDGQVMRVHEMPGLEKHILKTHLRAGYPSVNLYKNSKGADFTVHSLVAEAFIGPRPNCLVINHLNCDKTDNRVVNLEYTTPSLNRLHSIASGRGGILRGEESGAAKLTESQIFDIRRAIQFGATNKSLADSYGVAPSTISAIKVGRSWQHVMQSLPA